MVFLIKILKCTLCLDHSSRLIKESNSVIEDAQIRTIAQYSTSYATVLVIVVRMIVVSSGKLYKPSPFLYQSYKEGAVEIYVDAVNGNDDNSGDISHPLQSLVKAIELFRSQVVRSTTIYLRKGTYYLEQPVRLDSTDIVD